MSERPRWAREIHSFIHDEIIDDKYGWPEDDSADTTLDLIQSAVDAVLCNTFGHEIVDDQCMIPAHRYCMWCNRRESQLG